MDRADMPCQKQGPKYGEEYLKWKSWGDKSFGRLEKQVESYYSAEIRKTKLQNIHNVLEIGFGNGSFLTYAKKRNWNIIGIEMNDALVAQAKAFGYDARRSEAFDSLEADQFDLIVAFDVLEHISQDELPAFLTTIRKVLRAGGVLLARFPNGDSPFGLPYQNGDITHITSIGSGKVEYFAKAIGFAIISIGRQAQPIFCGSYPHFFHRLIANPIKQCLEFCIRMIFFPRSRIIFLSPNMVIVLKKD
jgi:SAM-dependent methyltransferase